MKKVLIHLIEKIKKGLKEKFSQFDFSKIDFSLEPTPNQEMGDFGFDYGLFILDRPQGFLV